MSNVSLTFAAYSALTNTDGTFKTVADIRKENLMENFINSEVAQSLYKAPEVTIEENIIEEFKVFPKGTAWTNDSTSSKKPSLNKVNYQFPSERIKFGYIIDAFGSKSVVDWSNYLSREDANINLQILNYWNALSVEAITDYNLATGQFKVLPNLGIAGKTEAEYKKDMFNLRYVLDSIASSQTKPNLGLDPKRMSVKVSYRVLTNMVQGINSLSASDKAFEMNAAGGSGSMDYLNWLGYKFERSIYLQKTNNEIVSTNTFDFNNVLGIVYNVDSLRFKTQSVLWNTIPLNDGEFSKACGWKSLSYLKPSQEYTTVSILTTAPTLAQINAARNKLFNSQPSAYKKLPNAALITMTDAEYNALKASWTEYSYTPVANINSGINTRNEETKKSLKDKITGK